jgi:ribosome assembly protein SQT1
LTTASADALLKTWDIRTGALIATHKGHGSIINGVAVATAPVQEEEEGQKTTKEVVVSAGDDGVSLVWVV